MFTYIKTQFEKYWNNPYLYYDVLDPDDMSFFGVTTLVSMFMVAALIIVGIINLAGGIPMPKLIGLSMIISGVISAAFGIVYGVTSSKVQEDWPDEFDQYDPNNIMVMVSVINEALFSGFFFVMLVICLVGWFFTTVFYSFPMLVIKMFTKPKRPQKPKNTEKKNIKKIVELTNQFTRYKRARI